MNEFSMLMKRVNVCHMYRVVFRFPRAVKRKNSNSNTFFLHCFHRSSTENTLQSKLSRNLYGANIILQL